MRENCILCYIPYSESRLVCSFIDFLRLAYIFNTVKCAKWTVSRSACVSVCVCVCIAVAFRQFKSNGKQSEKLTKNYVAACPLIVQPLKGLLFLSTLVVNFPQRLAYLLFMLAWNKLAVFSLALCCLTFITAAVSFR